MHRLFSLDITKPSHPTLSSVLYYDDSFIDDGLRLYDIKQAMHLYLNKNGYTTIVFYNTAEGFSSFEKEMLERFLTEVKEGNENQLNQGQHIQISPEQRGRRSGSRLASRLKKKEAGDSLVQGINDSVVADMPQINLWFDCQTQRWHRRTVGNRIASLDQIIYNMARREHTAIILQASDQESEFDASSTDKLVRTLCNIQDQRRRNISDSNDNRLIILINAQSCRQELMRLFMDKNNYPVVHKSIFMQDFFRNHMLTYNGDYYTLNFKTARPLSQPMMEDIKNVLLRARLDSGIDKPVEWTGINEICEQLSYQEKWTLLDLYSSFILKDEFTYKSLGVEKRGNAEEEMRKLIGIDGIIKQIDSLKSRISLALQRGDDLGKINKHMLFLGNPGTGKTTVARFIGSIFKDMGLVSKGHVVEVSREDLVAGYVGQTAIKTQKVLDSALDGILFVDEAYRLAQGGENDFGPEAVETIMKRMEDDSERLVVIFAGYEEDMQALYEVNSGVDSRFTNIIRFRDYTVNELKDIFMLRASKHYTLSQEVDELLPRLIEYALSYKSRSNDINYKFGNARWIRNLYEKVDGNIAISHSNETILRPEYFMGTGLKELDGFSFTPQAEEEKKSNEQMLMEMVGLDEVKNEVLSLIKSAELSETYRQLGIEGKKKGSMHMVFSGNPGTGKTTVARLIGQIYKEHGLLSIGHTVEIENRGKIVGRYMGDTGKNVNKLVDEARGGVLFIDEIYSLVQSDRDDFGREALNTLITRIENERDDMVVILAGYKELMDNFFSNNPGLQSRFNKYLNFEDYSAEELLSITLGFLQGEKKEFRVSDEAISELGKYITESKSAMGNKSGNARWARNFSEHIQNQHDARILRICNLSRDEAATFTAMDILCGIEKFERNKLATK